METKVEGVFPYKISQLLNENDRFPYTNRSWLENKRKKTRKNDFLVNEVDQKMDSFQNKFIFIQNLMFFLLYSHEWFIFRSN